MKNLVEFEHQFVSLKITYLYKHIVSLIPYSIILISLITILLWNSVPLHILLIGWLFISFINLSSYLHAKQVIRHSLWRQQSQQILRIVMIASLANGTAWAAILMLYGQYLSLFGEFFILLTLAGLAASVIVPLSAYCWAYMAYMIPLLIGSILYFVAHPNIDNLTITAVILIYYIALTISYYRSHRITQSNIRLQLEKDQLINTLTEKNKRINALLQLDELTQIPNRRFLFENLEKEYRRALRANTSLSVFMIDIDYFKAYNDNYGHHKGDQCLFKIAQLLQNTLKRSGDFVARYGGEEFMALLPNTNKMAAIGMGRKIIENVEAANFPHEYSEIAPHITVSIGIITLTPQLEDFDPDQIVTKADRALYKAKENGRNCLVVEK